MDQLLQTSLMQSSDVGALKTYDCESLIMGWLPDVISISGALVSMETSFQDGCLSSSKKALNFSAFSDPSPMDITCGKRNYEGTGCPTVTTQDSNVDICSRLLLVDNSTNAPPATPTATISSPALIQMLSTPTSSFSKRREEQTDCEFIDDLDQPFVREEKIEAGRRQFSMPMEAPIITTHNVTADDVTSETLQYDKENPIFRVRTARRNIFAHEVQAQAAGSASGLSPPRPRYPVQSNRFSVAMRERGQLPIIFKGVAGRTAWRKGCSVDDKLPWTAPSLDSMHPSNSASFTKCLSETDATATARRMDLLMAAADWVTQNDTGHVTLVGDRSRPCCLPVIGGGKHDDLTAISCETMAKVLKNEYDDVIESCTVVDCRYPFEYDGGHIYGAMNCYRKKDILDNFIVPLVERTTSSSSADIDRKRRHIVVFHCEFSSERGPNLMRFLRKADRNLHRDCYPALHHPEVYLLKGGYRDFQALYSDLCRPVGGYVPMIDQRYAHQLVQYRQASKLYKGNSEHVSTAAAAARGRYCRM